MHLHVHQEPCAGKIIMLLHQWQKTGNNANIQQNREICCGICIKWNAILAVRVNAISLLSLMCTTLENNVE